MDGGLVTSSGMTRRSFVWWGTSSACALAGISGCSGDSATDGKDRVAHRCPSWPELTPSPGAPVWPVPFSGALRTSLSLSGPWLSGAEGDRTVWLREARSGRLKWRSSAGNAGEPDKWGEPYYPQVIAAGGQVLVGGGDGDTTGEVVALCAANGKRMWRRKLPGNQVVEIAKSGAFVVAATQDHVFGLSAKTGRILWRVKVFQAGQIIAHGNILIFTHKGVEPFGAMALDRETGKLIWAEEIPDASDLGIKVAGSLVHLVGIRNVERRQDDGTTVFVTAPGELRTLSVENDRVEWTRALMSSDASFLSGGGLLHLVTDEKLITLHSDTGRTVWSIPLPEPVTPLQMVLHDDLLIVHFSVRVNGEYSLLALDPETGKEQWRVGGELSSEMLPGPSGVILVNTQGPKVRAVDTAGGEDIWSSPLKGAVQIVTNDLIYCHNGEEITVYDVSTGDLFFG
nr:PQQ-binding-like beta-propeller repeat protein [Streptomyces sp. NBC_01260]